MHHTLWPHHLWLYLSVDLSPWCLLWWSETVHIRVLTYNHLSIILNMFAYALNFVLCIHSQVECVLLYVIYTYRNLPGMAFVVWFQPGLGTSCCPGCWLWTIFWWLGCSHIYERWATWHLPGRTCETRNSNTACRKCCRQESLVGLSRHGPHYPPQYTCKSHLYKTVRVVNKTINPFFCFVLPRYWLRHGPNVYMKSVPQNTIRIP